MALLEALRRHRKPVFGRRASKPSRSPRATQLPCAQPARQPNAAAARQPRSMAPKPKSDAENKEERRCEAAALEIVNKGGNVGKDLRRKDKVLITIPRRRRVFQDGIGRWNDILSDHLGFSQKLEKGVPSNDASLSMRRTLREAGVKVPGVAKKKRTRTASTGPSTSTPLWRSQLP